MYRVIHYFTDLQDHDHPYNVGDVFPRDGLAVSDARIAELAGNKNKQGMPLILKTADSTVEKKTGRKRTKKTIE